MLGDPDTLEHWDRPLTRAESVRWIDTNLERYAAEGYGLWVVEHGGEPLGDCGIVLREVEGEPEVEVGLPPRAAPLGQRLRDRGGGGVRSSAPASWASIG